MANKDKETMDYWRHSTILYERTEMQLAVSTVGFDAYGLYCFLMEKVNFNINTGLALDEDRITLFASQVKLSIERFKDILKELLKRNLFNKDHYENTGLLTNDASEDGKEMVITTRQQKREYISRRRKEKIVDNYNANVFCKDTDKVIDRDIPIDIDKPKDIDIPIDKDIETDKEIVIDINKISNRKDMYHRLQNLFYNEKLTNNILNEFENYHNSSPEIFVKAVELAEQEEGITINEFKTMYSKLKMGLSEDKVSKKKKKFGIF